jgi:hypothetical protein
MQTVVIVVKLTLNDVADINEVLSEMDYSITHKDIIDTEIVDVLDS